MGGVGGPAANTRQAYTKGPIGVMSRSGGMTTEIANTLTAAGLGQSTARLDRRRRDHRLDLRRADAALRGRPRDEGDRDLLRAGRPHGGRARRVGDASTSSRLPIVAFMAGRFMDEMPGMRFGHAGTIVEGKEDTTAEKIARMEAAGISVAERIEEIPALIRERLAEGSTER